MYITDLFSRYTQADFVQSKYKDVFVSKIIELWFPIFGNPDMSLMDNGGKFENDTMRELGNLFGTNIKHTAGYSPWSNSVNEHNHATVDLVLTKMLEDLLNLDERMALKDCISIKTVCIFEDIRQLRLLLAKPQNFHQRHKMNDQH